MKKSSETAKERVETFINLYKDLQESAKIVQKCIKRYYNLKISKGLDFKKGNCLITAPVVLTRIYALIH